MTDKTNSPLPSLDEIAKQQSHPQFNRVLDEAVAHGLKSEVISFQRPQVVAGIECNGLLLREPVAYDLGLLADDYSDNSTAGFRKFVERLASVGEGELDYIPALDYVKMTDWVNRFLAYTQ